MHLLQHLLELWQKCGILRFGADVAAKDGSQPAPKPECEKGAMMLVGLKDRPARSAWANRARRGGAALTIGTMITAGFALPAFADDLPEQIDGVTMRTFQLPSDPGHVCQLRPGTTPNVDDLRPNID